MLPAGDASVDSAWFREIHVPRAWRVYLATGFDFREKNRVGLGSIGVPTLASISYLSPNYEGRVNRTISPETSCTGTTTDRHMVSFTDFYLHFLANFQT